MLFRSTPEQMAKQNQINKENRIRRLIKANFYPSDLWVTLKYQKGTRKPYEQVMKDMALFLQRLRYRYKKLEDVLKYIYRIEIGKRGGIHVHILLNRTKCSKGTDTLIAECWTFVLSISPHPGRQVGIKIWPSILQNRFRKNSKITRMQKRQNYIIRPGI